MFRKREKKTFPPGTFIPTPARLAAIIHLCLAFSFMLWVASQPFMGDLFAIKSELVLYEAVIEKKDLLQELDSDEAQSIIKRYETLKEKLQIPFVDKIKMMLRLLMVQMSSWEQAWLLFSLVVPLLLLLRIEGSIQVCWLLPVITLAYCLDNQFNASHLENDSHRSVFPSEQYIVHRYLNSVLSADILSQQRELRKGWEHYLIEEWAQEVPAAQFQMQQQQIVKGEFAFNLARIKARQNEKILAVHKVPQKQSPWILGIYFLWNCFFAWIAFSKVGRAGSKICTG